MTRIAATTLSRPAENVWRAWGLLGMPLFLLGLLRQASRALWPRQPKSTAQLRADEKQRQKTIRRQLRGLE
jgi:hypothetical protein